MPTDGPPRDDNPLRTPEATRDRLVELRADFARLAENGEPLAARILQNDTGVAGRGNNWIPEWEYKPIAWWSLGRNAFTHRTGAGVQLQMTRTIQFAWKFKIAEHFRYWPSFDRATVRAGAILDDLRSRYKRVLDGWKFKDVDHTDTDRLHKSRWWALLFELAKDKQLPGTNAKEHGWEHIHGLLIKYPIEPRGGNLDIHTTKPPTAYMVTLLDPARACCELCDLLLAELGVHIKNWPGLSAPDATPNTDADHLTQNKNSPPKQKRGRKRDTDPKADKVIAEAWNTGSYKTHAELANELGKDTRAVKLALDRHRKR